VSLSIADAKVDSFNLTTKLYRNFFDEKNQEKSQNTDLQTKQKIQDFTQIRKNDIFMLQNMVFTQNEKLSII